MAANNRAGTNIRITGVKQTVRALKEFQPALYKQMNREIRSALQVVKDRARGKYPTGDWAVRVNTKNLLGTVTATARGGAAPSWANASGGQRAAIFEFAGSRTMGATPQAKGLIESLTRRYGTPGRFLWAAWDESATQVLSEIEGAVKRAERDLQANLDAAGEGF